MVSPTNREKMAERNIFVCTLYTTGTDVGNFD